MVIRQGDIFWLEDDEPYGSEPGYTRPYVVIQNDFYNNSRLKTVLACALTSNLRRANAPENILLAPSEAHLPQQSVVVTSQTVTIDKTALGEYIGTLSAARIAQIIQALSLLTTPRTAPENTNGLHG